MFDPYKPVGLEASIGALPELPKLPGQKKRPVRQAQQKKPSDDDSGIQGARRDMLLDKPKIRETKPGPGDDQMELDPSSDFPIPSSPRQDSPGDDIMQGPMFSHGVRQANLLNSRATAAPPEIRAAIVRAAHEAGISPAYGLATAERESSFNPDAGGRGTIKGLFQMSGALRKQYGIPENATVDQQAKGFVAFTRDLRDDMAERLGREPTDVETYMGHHFGGARAARIIARTDPSTPVSDLFTPNELAGNPHIVKAGTAGALTQSIAGDMERRVGQHQQPSREDFAKFGQLGTPPERLGNESRQGAEPGWLPGMTYEQGLATKAAQQMPKVTPTNPEAFDTAVASFPKSDNIENREGEVEQWARESRKRTSAKQWDDARQRGKRQEPQNFAEFGDFSEFGSPLSTDAGAEDIAGFVRKMRPLQPSSRLARLSAMSKVPKQPRQGFGDGVSMNTSSPEQAEAYDRDFQPQDRFAELPKSRNVEDRRQEGPLSRTARGFADFGRTYVDNVKGAIGLSDDGQVPENEFTQAIPKAVEADKARPLKSYENVLPTLPTLPGGQDFATFGKPSDDLGVTP